MGSGPVSFGSQVSHPLLPSRWGAIIKIAYLLSLIVFQSTELAASKRAKKYGAKHGSGRLGSPGPNPDV